MKKFLWLLFLFPIFIGKVYANDIYYSEYTSFSDWQEQEITASDIVNVEKETRNLWYQINQIPGEYTLYESNGKFLSDCYNTEMTAWSVEKPQTHESRNIQERNQYIYKIAKGVRYIHLTQLHGSYGAIRIPELRTIVNGVDLNYTYTCSGCRENFGQYIHNGNAVENKSFIDNGGSIIIDLGKIYPIHQLELQFYIFDMGNDNKTYTLGFSEDQNNIYASNSYVLNFVHATASQAEYIQNTIYNIGTNESNWMTTNITNEPFTSDFEISHSMSTEYAYTEKWCKTYTETIQYYPKYTVNQPFGYPYKDGQAKQYYRFQTRDKLELSEITLINAKNYDLNNFIIQSTKPYSIEQNIDWNKNGMYPITIKSGDIEVTKNVTVQIIENQIVEYEKEIETLKLQLRQLQKLYQDDKLEFENQILNLTEQISLLQEELQNCQTNCEQEKLCLENIIISKENQLIKYENSLKNLSDHLNELQINLENKQSELSMFKEQNIKDRELIKKLEVQIENMKVEGNKISQDMIDEYTGQLVKKDGVIKAYENKIQELLRQFNNTNQNIGQVIKEREIYYQKNIELQTLIDKLYEEQEDLYRQLTEYKTNFKNWKDLSSELEISKKEKYDLNQKLNNYVLKIKMQQRVNIGWLISIGFLLCLFLLIERKRKKSNIK